MHNLPDLGAPAKVSKQVEKQAGNRNIMQQRKDMGCQKMTWQNC